MLLEWTALTHPDHERTTRWYIAGAVFGAACMVYGIVSGAWSFVLVMLLIAGMYAFMHRVPPSSATLRIAEDGITYSGTFTPWALVRDFWVLNLPQWNELHIMKTKGGLRELIIHTNDISVPQLKATLSQYIKERVDQKERVMDRIIRLCKL